MIPQFPKHPTLEENDAGKHDRMFGGMDVRYGAVGNKDWVGGLVCDAVWPVVTWD
jgi:hypothetical protein